MAVLSKVAMSPACTTQELVMSQRPRTALNTNICSQPKSRSETATLLRRTQEPQYLKKTQGFASESFFTREFTRFRIVALPKLLDNGWLA